MEATNHIRQSSGPRSVFVKPRHSKPSSTNNPNRRKLIKPKPRPQLTSRGFQVAVVDYERPESLLFALRGIHTVISTVTGPNQTRLITAALETQVRRFAPAEFQGPLRFDTPSNDFLARQREADRFYLRQNAFRIESTTFVCGVLYERFQPGGLARANIATNSSRSLGLSGEGDFVMDIRRMYACVPAFGASGAPDVAICMTAARDVARFVVKALDLPQWPPELRVCGLRILVKDLVLLVQSILGRSFAPIEWHSPSTLREQIAQAVIQRDVAQQVRLRALLSTAEGRYDFAPPHSLNDLFPQVITVDFATWLAEQWNVH